MASNERLTKRVKKIEDWVKENEEMGGPKGYLDTIVTLINSTIEEEWDKYVKEQDNAVQEQQTEEVSVQEQAESSEEVSETPEEKKK